jgi:predicted esterase
MRVLDVRRPVRRAMAVICAFFGAFGVTLVLLVGAREGSAGDLAAPAPAPATDASGLPAPTARVGLPATSARAPSPAPTSRQTLTTAAGTPVHAFPPLVTEGATPPRPMVVMLHGMCSQALPTCDFWSAAGREGSWLVCPTGNAVCGGEPDWKGTGPQKAASIDASLATVDAAFGPHIDHAAGDVLIGFSRGAFVARDVVYERPGRWTGVILVGASLSPDPARFKAAGVRRVVLAAGDYDGARPAMQRAAATLTAGGVPARYVSLGRIGHWLPDDFETKMRDALRWVREGSLPHGT